MEQNKIPPTPWESKSMKVIGVESTRIMDAHGYYIAHQEGIRSLTERDNISNAIVTAVNNTYGKGIQPESVPGLLTALQNILLDVEPMKGGETVSIPAVSIKLIKAAIDKATIK